MIDETLIADLVRAGLAPELVGRVANAIVSAKSAESPVDIAAEKRRAYDRARKAEKRNSTGLSTGIPPDTDSALSSSAPPPTQASKEVKKERARGHRIPPDWKPSADHYQQAGDDMRRDRRWVDQRATDMRIWAETNHHRAVARKSDWDLTFTGWMRREAGNNRGANDESKSVLAAADRQIERFGGMEAARAYVPGSSGPEPLSLDFGTSAPRVRLIPKG